MKKNLIPLALVLLSLCLAIFAFDRIIPALPVQAAAETHPVLSSSNPFEKEPLPPAPPAQPAVMVVIGLVCLVFGSIAITPLAFFFPSRSSSSSGPGRISRD